MNRNKTGLVGVLASLFSTGIIVAITWAALSANTILTWFLFGLTVTMVAFIGFNVARIAFNYGATWQLRQLKSTR